MIKEGDVVVIRMHDDKSSCVLKVRGEQKIGRARVKTRPLIGHPYESVFELRDKDIVRVEDDPAFLDKAFETQTQGLGNNSLYVDTNTAQKLNDIDIQSMKQSGATGIDIMKSLIANSDTWADKTEFAQQKWLTRKSKKYMRRFRVCRSTPALMCEALYNKQNASICGLRSDTLAQMMSHGGVYAGARVLVCDSTFGLVVGSIAYRMRGHGRILSLFAGQQPHLENVENLNLTEMELGNIRSIPLNELAASVDFVSGQGFMSNSQDNAMDLSDPTPCARSRGKPLHSSCRRAHELVRARQLLCEGVNSLVIVCSFRPLTVLQEAIYLLTPSSPFAVHCEYLELLVECYLFLQLRNLAVRMSLSDTWQREYQTLPGRLHPHMNMSASGGYILSGIYVGDALLKNIPDSENVELPEVEVKMHVSEEDIEKEGMRETEGGHDEGLIDEIDEEQQQQNEEPQKKKLRR
jgi:tRNA (adenine-N(1)-)-methyltransferase non-catalytic subunit